MTPEGLNGPDLDWSSGQPVSRRFGDVYYSRDNGLAESRYVFLQHNRLEERWQSLTPASDFSIGETGFGTGLNFLSAVELWLRTAPADCRLHYVSVEKYPLGRADLSRALTQWPELATLATALVEQYPPLVSGFHRRWLQDRRVSLTLLFGDAETAFASLAGSNHPQFAGIGNARVDAWFLDGFAPSRNPDLWTDNLFRLLARLSAAGTTLATFTAAGLVRRGLQSVGFTVAKMPGFGRKRDMLQGVMAGRDEPEPAPNTGKSPSRRRAREDHELPWHLDANKTPPSDRNAVVIGGGIAGCSTASALTRRGWRVTLVERQPQLASGASGNPQGIVYAKLSARSSTVADFGLAALCHALGYYRALWRAGSCGADCGVLVLPENPEQARAFAGIAARYQAAPELVLPVTGGQLTQVAGVPLQQDIGLLCPGLGWLDPASVCRQLATHDDIAHLTASVEELQWQDQHARWRLLDANAQVITESPVVIVACGETSHRFAQTQHLPLKPIRGQITSIPATAASQNLKTAICGHGYLAPARQGLHTLGASYNLDNLSLALDPDDHAGNLAAIERTDPCLGQLFAETTDDRAALARLGGRAALRCTTPDYLPVAGPAPCFDDFVRRFAPLRDNARADINATGSFWPGLYLNCGHGSRGLAYAPLTAELIAADLNGEIPPLPRNLRLALHPARFIIRGLKRKCL